MLRLTTFNINGIRARLHQLAALQETYNPDLIGLQETKVDDPQFPVEALAALGYHLAWFGQKGHYGVALLSRFPLQDITKGLPGDAADAQRRLISAALPLADGRTLRLINGYFPQGENRAHPVKFPAKREFYARLRDYRAARAAAGESLIIMGDMNVAPGDLDVGIGADNAKRWLRTGSCSFLPEEREWLQALQGEHLSDLYRSRHGDSDPGLSWFDYRSRGFEKDPKHGLRIDLILGSNDLLPQCRDAGVAYDIRGMEKPSDHCPVWVDLDLDLKPAG